MRNFVTAMALLGAGLLQMSGDSETASSRMESVAVTGEQRAELLVARETAWRSFFSDDPARLERLLGPEVIAIQPHQENWENRDQLIALARGMQRQGTRITRLEFPRTEIQIFGDVAILYFTYVFGTATAERSGTFSGRGTEIFVRRDGRWIDVGWHTDNGAFVRRDGTWTRVGADPSSPS
ncbi:nuclear transport factor 2 family protein [Sphingosinicella sp. LHD-64]|uniref:nuclear transport factor 2 family protein n=1 Tax=Sphingosinicella sp. LHD-64 TaxID=3072139 RepID=UPI00280CAE24|nr:nuclear transport factor 2 family protein [Sphingosinicella sp. LHD-64]MDQ8755723.1 nuclear transport factor 2 family protein [Sphingosinicella sp. LHD-64]